MTCRRFALAVALALLASPLAAGETEDQAVKAIEKLGGKITFDEKAPGKPVVAVNLYKAKVTDADLKHLAVLKQLQRLDLNGTQVTDAGLKDLAALTQL